MNAVFHPAAQIEAQKATAHYTEIHKQLGREFRIELEGQFQELYRLRMHGM